MPPLVEPSALTAARSIAGSMVVFTVSPGVGAVWASTRLPALSVPPGVPASLRWNTRSSPDSPTLVSGG